MQDADDTTTDVDATRPAGITINIQMLFLTIHYYTTTTLLQVDSSSSRGGVGG